MHQNNSKDIIINFSLDAYSVCWSVWGDTILDVSGELNTLDRSNPDAWEDRMDVVFASIRELFASYGPNILLINDPIYEVMLGTDYKTAVWMTWVYWTIINIAKSERIAVVITNCLEKTDTESNVVPFQRKAEASVKEQ
jgi:hypothetical protein